MKKAEVCDIGTKNILEQDKAMKKSATGCSVEEAMRLLGGRWRLLLVSYLLDGPKRFNDLRRDVPGISQRMLTLDLRALEQVGLIQRTVFAEVPVKVEYQLTESGQRLRPVVEVMRDFGLWLKSRPEPVTEDLQIEAAGQAQAVDLYADRMPAL
jgi:DNA-binding HxlR family transcriptional regulator